MMLALMMVLMKLQKAAELCFERMLQADNVKIIVE